MGKKEKKEIKKYKSVEDNKMNGNCPYPGE